MTFSRHPDSARDGAGRGTGRRPAAGAAPLSGQGLRGWDLPSAHRRQAPTVRRPGPALSARRPGALITQPREAGTARRLLTGKERGLRVTGGQGHRATCSKAGPEPPSAPRAPWHLPRRARLRTVLRGLPLAKRACRGQCRPTGRESVQGRGCTSSTFVSWTAGLGRAHSRCSVNIGVDWPDLQRPRSRLQQAPSGRLSQAVRTVAQAAAHAAPPPPPAVIPCRPGRGSVRDGRSLLPPSRGRFPRAGPGVSAGTPPSQGPEGLFSGTWNGTAMGEDRRPPPWTDPLPPPLNGPDRERPRGPRGCRASTPRAGGSGRWVPGGDPRSGGSPSPLSRAPGSCFRPRPGTFHADLPNLPSTSHSLLVLP